MNDERVITEQNGDDVSERVIYKIADVLNLDPLELAPLYETVDPDALNSLFQTSSGSRYNGRVEFTVEGCDVTVYETGRVEVASPEESTGKSAIDTANSTVETSSENVSTDD
jgi:hypothetical protein